jgi:hypothetical protein
MKTLKGTVKQGRIALSEPMDWPEGTEVRVSPVPESANGSDEPDASLDEQNDDPESVAKWIAEFNSIPPLQMSPQEEADWQAARAAQRAYEMTLIDRDLGAS